MPGSAFVYPLGRVLVRVVVEGPSEVAPEGIEPSKVKALSTLLDETPSLDKGFLTSVPGWLRTPPPSRAYLLPLPPGLLGAKAKQGRSAVLKREKKATWLRGVEEGRDWEPKCSQRFLVGRTRRTRPLRRSSARQVPLPIPWPVCMDAASSA